MAGPLPKPQEQRARKNRPALGEWRNLAPIETPVLPALPKVMVGDDPAKCFACVCGRRDFASERALRTHIGMAKQGRHQRLEKYVDPAHLWSQQTIEMWEGFRYDIATQEYGPSEIAQARQLAHLIELAVRSGSTSMWAEVRQWMDRLMLTPKGKRDARIRLCEKPELRLVRSAPTPDFRAAQRRRLLADDPGRSQPPE